MLGDRPALLGSPSQRLGWMSLEIAQLMFLFDVRILITIITIITVPA